MNIIVSFSARKDGNCDTIARYISSENDLRFNMRELDLQPCANCNYECMTEKCIYNDEIYSLLEKCSCADKVFFIVPMYCGNPSALYFILNERSQDFFMRNESLYEEFTKKLYIIGVYGNKQDYPDFLKLFQKQYEFSDANEHILGLERHLYHHKINDLLLNENEVREKIAAFAKNSDL